MRDDQTHSAVTVRFERAFIGSLLNGDIRATDSELRAADFTDTLCARVFGAALTLEARGKVCDLVTVTEFCPDLDANALVELAQEAAPVASLAAQHARSMARVSGISVHNIATRRLSYDDNLRLVEFSSLLPADRFCIADKVQTPQDVRREALRMRANGGLDLIAVDYLQLMEPGRKTGNRTEAVGVISRSLKLLAMELGVPVLTASQLNRASEKNDAPLLCDLRESGSIEQDADAVLLLHAPDDKEQPSRTLTIAKNRDGACGGAYLLFDGSRMLFANDERRDGR